MASLCGDLGQRHHGEEDADDLRAIVGLLREDPAFAVQPFPSIGRVANGSETRTRHEVSVGRELGLGSRGPGRS